MMPMGTLAPVDTCPVVPQNLFRKWVSSGPLGELTSCTTNTLVLFFLDEFLMNAS